MVCTVWFDCRVLYCICMVLYCTVLFALHGFVLYCISLFVLHGFVLYFIVCMLKFCIVFYCLYCIVLYCIECFLPCFSGSSFPPLTKSYTVQHLAAIEEDLLYGEGEKCIHRQREVYPEQCRSSHAQRFNLQPQDVDIYSDLFFSVTEFICLTNSYQLVQLMPSPCTRQSVSCFSFL